MLAQQLAAVDLGEERALVERVDDEDVVGQPRRRRERRAQEEVSGEVHAGDAQAGAARDLEVDHREADRDAGAAIQHFVQKAVARIVVAIAVSAKPLLVVEVLVERADRILERDLDRQGRSGAEASSPMWSSSSRYGAVSSDGYSTLAIASAAGARSSPGVFIACSSSAAT